MASSPATEKSGKKDSPHKNKENKLPPPGLDWRQVKASPLSTPRSFGIPPRSFHSANSRVRARPGNDHVQEIHAKSAENALREQKKEHSKAQQTKRSAFKELTSLKTWPLQDLAVQDYNSLVKAYLNEDDTRENVDKGSESPTPDHKHGDSSSSCASTDRKRIMTDQNVSPSKSQLKQKCLDDFRTEREIPSHNVATSSCDPTKKFDPGLWSLEPRIFSVERSKGKRKYLVGHLGRLMDHMWRKTDKCNRYFYELILEKTPCRLYFDLEYSVPDNPGIDNEQLLKELYKELTTELYLQYRGHVEGFDQACIIDLDSSTPQKFSRHWIVHLPSNALFKDNQEVGKFVKTFIEKLADDAAIGMLEDRCSCLQKHLFVNPKGTLKDKDDELPDLPMSKKTCFIDTGVYTRNRLFRLIGSSKWGKSPDCALRFADNNQFPLPRGFGNERFYVPAMTKSESSDTSDDEDVLDERAKANCLEKFKAQTDWSLHAQVTARTLVVPLNIHKIDYPILPEIEDKSSADTKKIDQHFSGPASSIRNGKIGRCAAYASTRPRFGSSPYPFLDNFILEDLAGRGGVQGSIRAWALDYGPNGSCKMPTGISYHMSRNRWCEGIGRAHRSNNILWKVDFQQRQCIQSCFDPDCRSMNFRGRPIDLPCGVALQLDDAIFEEQIARMDESELLGKAQNKQPVQPRSPSNFDDDDDFEKALAGLNLEPTDDEGKAKESYDDAFSDDALLDALSQNPELFH